MRLQQGHGWCWGWRWRPRGRVPLWTARGVKVTLAGDPQLALLHCSNFKASSRDLQEADEAMKKLGLAKVLDWFQSQDLRLNVFCQNDAEWEAELEGELNEYEMVKPVGNNILFHYRVGEYYIYSHKSLFSPGWWWRGRGAQWGADKSFAWGWKVIFLSQLLCISYIVHLLVFLSLHCQVVI